MRISLGVVVALCWTTTTSRAFAPPISKSSAKQRPLHASTAVDSSHLVFEEKPGWHRRVIRKVFRRRSLTKTRAIALPISSEETNYETRRWFLAYFRGQQRPMQLSIAATTTSPSPSSSLAARWLERTVERNLLERFDRWTLGSHENMKISCTLAKPPLNILRRCELSCDAVISADKLIFPAFQCSGGYLQAKNMSLNLLSFTKFKNTPRYPEAFEFQARDLTMTSEDLLHSNCIRNGLRRLLTRILHRSQRFLSGVQVEIHQLEIMESSEIACRGVALTKLAVVPFEVRTRLGISGRGHILTLPGLELSIPGIRLRLALPDVTVDVGHNTILQDIRITQQYQLKVSAKVRITPEHTRLVQHQQRSESFGALCSVDVGQWLTHLGRFSQ